MAQVVHPSDWLDDSTTVCFGIDDDGIVNACAKRECDPDHNQVIWSLSFSYDVHWAVDSDFEKPALAADGGIEAFVADCFNEMIAAAGKLDKNAIQAGCNAVRKVLWASRMKADEQQ